MKSIRNLFKKITGRELVINDNNIDDSHFVISSSSAKSVRFMTSRDEIKLDFMLSPSLRLIDFSSARNLTKLGISKTRIPQIKNPPNTLREFDILDCRSLESFDLIAFTHLEKLHINNSRIKLLENFPESLKELAFIKCESLESLDLSQIKALEEIDISSSGVKSLKGLPNTLKIVRASFLPSLEFLDLASLINLEEIHLVQSKISSIETNLPRSLRIINMSGCDSLEYFNFSSFALLEEFNFSYSRLKAVENIPSKLKKINVSGCEFLESLGDLSSLMQLQDLNISGSRIRSLENLPRSLKKLSFATCTISDPSIDLSLLTELEELNCSWSNIESLTNLSKTIKVLNLANCKSLKSLEDLLNFTTLKDLDLSGCISLPNTPAIVNQLEGLEEKNKNNPDFRLVWPNHIDRSGGKIGEIINSLKEAYRKFYANNPDFSQKEPNYDDRANYPILVLFHRFLNESAAVRGGVKKIAESAFPTAEYIKNNPQILEFINESAKSYLDACINQPVAGFVEISCLVNIAKQPDISKKLEAAKIIMAVELVKKEITNVKNPNGDFVGEAVEAELANAMLLAVNQKLIKDDKIREPFPGIPDGIAYQATINSFLTVENIELISLKVLEILNQEPEKIANYLCEGHFQDFWANMVLSEEKTAQIKSRLPELEKAYELDGSEKNLLELSSEKEAVRKQLLIESKKETFDFVASSQSSKPNQKLKSVKSETLFDNVNIQR